MYQMRLKNYAVYTLADDGTIIARSDGPQGWNYGVGWKILGFGKRVHSNHLVTLSQAANGIDFGQGWVHDLDHGTHRMWGSAGKRLASIRHVQGEDRAKHPAGRAERRTTTQRIHVPAHTRAAPKTRGAPR